MNDPIARRTILHFQANETDGRISPAQEADIVEQLREEFPDRKVSPAYVKTIIKRISH